MNEFKINLFFKENEITFQSLMNDIFLQYISNKLEETL